MQAERVVLLIEHPRRKSPRRGIDVPVCVRVPGVNVTAHADTRGFENLIQSRNGKKRRNGGSKKKLFHCWTFQLVERRTGFSTARARFFLVSDQWAEGSREWNNEIPRTCVGHNKVVVHHSRAVGQH